MLLLKDTIDLNRWWHDQCWARARAIVLHEATKPLGLTRDTRTLQQIATRVNATPTEEVVNERIIVTDALVVDLTAPTRVGAHVLERVHLSIRSDTNDCGAWDASCGNLAGESLIVIVTWRLICRLASRTRGGCVQLRTIHVPVVLNNDRLRTSTHGAKTTTHVGCIST